MDHPWETQFSGAIWTQVLPYQLEKRLGNTTSAEEWYTFPFSKILEYPVGTPERAAIIDAFRHVQRLLCATGAALCLLLIVCSCIIRNPELPDTQSIDNAEERLFKMSYLESTPETINQYVLSEQHM